MDYYERKRKTLEIIDGLIEKGEFTRDDIQLAVLKNTLLGKKFVNDYINMGFLNGWFIVDKKTGILSNNILSKSDKKEAGKDEKVEV